MNGTTIIEVIKQNKGKIVKRLAIVAAVCLGVYVLINRSRTTEVDEIDTDTDEECDSVDEETKGEKLTRLYSEED